jgi:hypothetical protein
MGLSQLIRYIAFSIRLLREDEEVVVLFEQQMLLYQSLDLQVGSSLIIEGEVVIL